MIEVATARRREGGSKKRGKRKGHEDRSASTTARQGATSSEEPDTLPPFMYHQCAGYAYATARLIHTMGSSRGHGAASFILNTRGTVDDKIEGCGALVNAVNAAAKNGEIQDVTVIA